MLAIQLTEWTDTSLTWVFIISIKILSDRYEKWIRASKWMRKTDRYYSGDFTDRSLWRLEYAVRHARIFSVRINFSYNDHRALSISYSVCQREDIEREKNEQIQCNLPRMKFKPPSASYISVPTWWLVTDLTFSIELCITELHSR